MRASLPRHIAPRAQIGSVPLLTQTSPESCAAAAAAMALAPLGLHPPLTELDARLRTPARGGTLQVDLLGLGRRLQLMTLALNGMPALLEEVAAGQPVIVLLNLRHDLWPQWHYAVVVGFDLDAGSLSLHSGSAKVETMSLERFARRWAASQEWGLVYLKAGDTAPALGEDPHVGAALALERMGAQEAALKAYTGINQRWPDSRAALMGIGNTQHTLGNDPAARAALEKAVKAHPDAAPIWHNLALLRQATGDPAGAADAARKVTELGTSIQAPRF